MKTKQLHFFKYAFLTSLVLSGMYAHASTVRDDVDYQLFRDFAENKGKFRLDPQQKPANVAIFDKNGKSLGVMLQGVPMPDFSSANSKTGTHTLIDPQYVVSVAHNTATRFYQQQFGGQTFNPDNHRYTYTVVDINSHPSYKDKDGKTVGNFDYQAPRLAKLVTEVAPAITTQANLLPNTDDTSEGGKLRLTNFKDIFSHFVRLGSGAQHVMGKAGQQYVLNAESNKQDVTEPCRSDNHCTPVSSAYRYLTGGNPMPLYKINENGVLYVGGDTNADTPNFLYGNNPPMTSSTFGGDSGSPLFAYNKNTKQWELIAVLRGREWNEAYVSATNVLIKNEFNQNRMDEDKIVVSNTVAEKQYDWQITTDHVKNSILTDVGTVGVYAGTDYKPSSDGKDIPMLDASLNHGKTLHFKGEKGVLNLKSTLNQGAGALYFDNDFTVKADNDDITWLGAGVSVADGKTVNWQVKNPENDRLSKVGKGTLHVNGTGDNKGDISVGDGLVFLNQKYGKAFNQVGIVSGRGTVKLADDKQVDPNNIYFGYRGGRLDVNGNDLTFNYIQNVDDGATLVNHNKDKTATITVIGKKNDIHHTIIRSGEKRYHMRGDSTENIPDNNQVDLDFVYLADDGSSAFAKHRQQMQNLNLISAFNGFLGEKDPTKPNGALNFIYNPKGQDGIDHTYNTPQPTSSIDPSKYTLMLSGGSNLNGDLIAQAGTLLLSGRPTPYAIDAINRKELFKDDDWIDRVFKINNLVAENNSKLFVGRNVSDLTGNITIKNNAIGEIGFINGKTPVCIRSDHHGETECQTMSYRDNVLQAIPITNITGDITLSDEAKLTLGKAHLLGKSTAGENTYLTLGQDAKWTMTNSSTLGNLTMTEGSEITLNRNFDKGISDKFNLLTVAGNLTGKGKFNYLTNLTAFAGDKVRVNGDVVGNFLLNVKNQGTEPAKSKEHLTLLTALGTVSQAPKLANAGQVVDLGAYRYVLKSDDGKVYYLWSEGLERYIDEEAERKEAERKEAERKEAERKEAERKEAERKEAERKEAERKEAERKEAERKEAERKEAERKEAERKEAERKEAERKEAERKEAERKEAERKEAERKEAERKEAERKEAERKEAERKEAERKEAERKEAERKEAERKEAERKEAERKEAERKEAERKEAERKEAERKEAERKEAERKEAERKEAERKEAERKEAERKEAERKEAERKEAERKEAERKEAERKEAERKEAERKEAERKEAERKEAERKEAERKEAERKEAERKEAERKEAERKEAERKEAERKEAERKEAERKEAERKEAERKEAERKEAERKEAERKEAERKEAERKEAERKEAERKEAERKEAERKEAESAKQSQYTSKYTNLALSAQHADIRAVVRATTLAGRVLDVRPKHTGVWLHTQYGEFDRASDYYRGYSDRQDLVQFGVDDDFNVGKGVLILGAALSHAKGNQTFDEGRGDSRLTMAHLYGKWSFKDVFLGMDAGYGQVNHTIELGGSSRYRQDFANVGMVAGKTWQFSNSFIEPSLGVRHYQAFDSNAYTIDEANVRLLNFTATAYQPSVKFGYTHQTPTGLTFSPYVSTTYSHWTGETKLAVNGYQFSVPLVNEWQHKLGFDLQKGKFSGQLYATYDKDKESGDGYSAGLNIGYRW